MCLRPIGEPLGLGHHRRPLCVQGPAAPLVLGVLRRCLLREAKSHCNGRPRYRRARVAPGILMGMGLCDGLSLTWTMQAPCGLEPYPQRHTYLPGTHLAQAGAPLVFTEHVN